MEKRIDVVERKVKDLRLDFGNPRKIKSKKKKDLAASLEAYGDFDIIVINEQNQVIGGNQRVTILKEKDPETVVVCKMLVGYTDQEQKYVNIKLNTHAGEWVLDALVDWTADISVDLGLEDVVKKETAERSIPEMELIHYEKYDYVMIVCKNELDYNNLVRALGIEGAKVSISKRKINARAIWYEEMLKRVNLVPVSEMGNEQIGNSEEDKEE